MMAPDDPKPMNRLVAWLIWLVLGFLVLIVFVTILNFVRGS